MGVFKTIGGLIVLVLPAGLPFAAWDMLRSVVKPKPEDLRHWYDRALRVVGVLLLLALFIYFIVALKR